MAAGVLAAVLLPGLSTGAQVFRSRPVGVTAVTGESWLQHLHRSFDVTTMGKTGRLGPPDLSSGPAAADAAVRSASFPASSFRSSASVTVHGADLYRFNCQGCHGESGAGAPPEIGSVLDPVRATSAEFVRARMQNLGMQLNAGQAAEMAKQSKTALLTRIHNGGQDMPAFPHLSEAEIGSLIVYLKELAEMPEAQGRQVAVAEAPARVGEQIVKSTCHTCHSAEGVNPTPAQIAAGAIPPLSTLTARVNEREFVRKVTQGAPIVMGEPAALLRGRMPVFFYLSEQDAADVYQYLAKYPPQALASSGGEVQKDSQHPDQTVESGGLGNSGELSNSFANPAPPKLDQAIQRELKRAEQADAEGKLGVVPVLAFGLATPLLLLGGAITRREFKRIAAATERRKMVAHLRALQNFGAASVPMPMPMLVSVRQKSSYAPTSESA